MTDVTYDFESGDFSAFSPTVINGVIAVDTPGLNGTTYGCVLQHDPSPPHYAEDTMFTLATLSNECRLAGYINPGDIAFWSGDRFAFILLGSSFVVLSIIPDGGRDRRRPCPVGKDFLFLGKAHVYGLLRCAGKRLSLALS
jgi:hypothetical protein